MLAAVDWQNPLLWAVFVLWIMSVVLHEFAHGLVAYWGGDYTIKERGGLTLNPLQYVNPVTSILLPALFLLMGGVPLPGGATYIRRDLLRSRAWQAAVSAAGPLTNLLLGVACAVPLHPAVGWVDVDAGPGGWFPIQKLLGAMVVLQLVSVILNLIPVPPLDGFQMLSPFLDEPSRRRLTTPPVSTWLFLGFFVILWYVPGVMQAMYDLVTRFLGVIGFDADHVRMVAQSFNSVLYGTDRLD